MYIYGKNVAIDYLKKNKKVIKIIIQDNFKDKFVLNLIKSKNLPVEKVSKRQIDDLVDGLHQGIILSIPNIVNCDINMMYDKNFVVILDHIEDPHNFGAIIRTCEAAGVDGIIYPKDRAVDITPTVVKTSVGCVFDVNLSKVVNLSRVIDDLKDNGFWIVGTALNNSIDYRKIDYNGKIALVIGNEGKGISDLILKKCDFLANIPMLGNTNSLNASVAAGIMIYEVVRNRK